MVDHHIALSKRDIREQAHKRMTNPRETSVEDREELTSGKRVLIHKCVKAFMNAASEVGSPCEVRSDKADEILLNCAGYSKRGPRGRELLREHGKKMEKAVEEIRKHKKMREEKYQLLLKMFTNKWGSTQRDPDKYWDETAVKNLVLTNEYDIREDGIAWTKRVTYLQKYLEDLNTTLNELAQHPTEDVDREQKSCWLRIRKAEEELIFMMGADIERSPETPYYRGNNTGHVPFPTIVQDTDKGRYIKEFRRIVIGDGLESNTETNLNERRTMLKLHQHYSDILWRAFDDFPRSDIAKELIKNTFVIQHERQDFPLGPIWDIELLRNYSYAKAFKTQWSETESAERIMISAARI
jgi:hypothetical protein